MYQVIYLFYFLKSENTHVCVYKPKKKAEFTLKRFYFDEVA
jgi:hypothetical protein